MFARAPSHSLRARPNSESAGNRRVRSAKYLREEPNGGGRIRQQQSFSEPKAFKACVNAAPAHPQTNSKGQMTCSMPVAWLPVRSKQRDPNPKANSLIGKEASACKGFHDTFAASFSYLRTFR